MKKDLAKYLILPCVVFSMMASTAFASVNNINGLQQQQIEQYRQQTEALTQQTEQLKQQVEYLRQQSEAVRQGQLYNQAYSQGYSEGMRDYQRPAYVQRYTYNPAPFYGGLGVGYILGHWSYGCGHCCHRCWH